MRKFILLSVMNLAGLVVFGFLTAAALATIAGQSVISIVVALFVVLAIVETTRMFSASQQA